MEILHPDTNSSSQRAAERPVLPAARPIDERAIAQALAERDGFKQYLVEEKRSEKLHESMVSNLALFNPAVAEFTRQALNQCRDDAEQQRLTDLAFALYWAAKFAHDPNDQLEYDASFDPGRASATGAGSQPGE